MYFSILCAEDVLVPALHTAGVTGSNPVPPTKLICCGWLQPNLLVEEA